MSMWSITSEMSSWARTLIFTCEETILVSCLCCQLLLTLYLVASNYCHYLGEFHENFFSSSHWRTIFQMDCDPPTIWSGFTTSKAKKYLVFTELLLGLPIVEPDKVNHDPVPNEFVYLVDSTDPRYGYILVYLQTQRFHPDISSTERHCICHQNRHYLMLKDTLYHCGTDSVVVVSLMPRWNMF